MATEEKLLTIPLRGHWLKKARVSRTQRSIKEVKYYLYKHMKATDVKMSELLNEAMWKGGAKRPLHTVKVKASKDEKGIVTVILPEEKIVVEEKKGVAAKLLRRKGKIVKRIVLDKPKKEEAKTTGVEHKHEHKPGEEHKHAEEKPIDTKAAETKPEQKETEAPKTENKKPAEKQEHKK